MSKLYNNKPIVPYFMNSPYLKTYENCYNRQGYMSAINYNVPLNKESRNEVYSALKMHEQRNKYYDYYLKHWVTTLSDLRTVTVQREKKGLIKYVHTPSVISERFHTEYEYSFLKSKVFFISAMVVIGIALASFLLCYFNVF